MLKLIDRWNYFDALLKFKNLLEFYDNELGIRTNKQVQMLLDCIIENLDAFIECPELMNFKLIKNNKGKTIRIQVYKKGEDDEKRLF